MFLSFLFSFFSFLFFFFFGGGGGGGGGGFFFFVFLFLLFFFGWWGGGVVVGDGSISTSVFVIISLFTFYFELKQKGRLFIVV